MCTRDEKEKRYKGYDKTRKRNFFNSFSSCYQFLRLKVSESLLREPSDFAGRFSLASRSRAPPGVAYNSDRSAIELPVSVSRIFLEPFSQNKNFFYL